VGYVEIEVRAKTVDLAVEAAMQELGVESREQLSVEVIQEPVKGFLGIGGQDAVVRVKRRQGRRRSRSRRKGGSKQATAAQSRGNRRREGTKSAKNRPDRRRAKPAPASSKTPKRTERPVSDDRPEADIEEQARVVEDFLTGLVDAYGLEGSVGVTWDDGVILADVGGEQTEALVGARGATMIAIHELTRTVLQRHTREPARLRLDIAGYAQRRRQALTIYAEQLIEQLMAEGGEIMLEPMSASDRKVIHDVAAAHEGVTSYSEGESPGRYVVLSRVAAEDSNSEEE